MLFLQVVLISATTGQRTEKLFESIERASQQFSRRISTAVINEVVNDATMWMAPPSVGSRSGELLNCPLIVFVCFQFESFNKMMTSRPPTVLLEIWFELSSLMMWLYICYSRLLRQYDDYHLPRSLKRIQTPYMLQKLFS